MATRSVVTEQPSGCKHLWFAGMSEQGKTAHEYRSFYAVALLSARRNAAEALQPVLMLGRFNLSAVSRRSAFSRWASGNGAIVVLRELSFQRELLHLVGRKYGIDHSIGPFLRLEIPSIVEQHKLFERPGVCRKYVLYTDTDVLFATPIRPMQVQLPDGAFAAYGAESSRHDREPTNTGVMFIDVPQFRLQWPSILEFGRAHRFDFPAFDQGWLNAYFRQPFVQRGRTMLPLEWNWKVYWGGRIGHPARIIHFHGPKPGRSPDFLECLASGDHACVRNDSAWQSHPYHPLVMAGFEVDGGRMANVSLRLYRTLLQEAKLSPCWPRSDLGDDAACASATQRGSHMLLSISFSEIVRSIQAWALG